MALIQPGNFHRLALAIDDADTVYEWFTRTLGAAPLVPEGHAGDADGDGEADLAGAETRLLRLGGYPIILLSKGAPGGPVASFLGRYGPGVHSLAWEVDDLWSAQNLLQERGIRIGAVSIPGRHFFMHPKDTHGVLMEWTDDTFGKNERRTDEGGGRVDVLGMAWVSAAVHDADAAASFLVDLAGASVVDGNPRGDANLEVTVDVQVGDVTLRLITPRTPRSRYAPALADGPRLCSFALRVAALDEALGTLASSGVPVLHRDGDLAATDPASTFGLPIEWTA